MLDTHICFNTFALTYTYRRTIGYAMPVFETVTLSLVMSSKGWEERGSREFPTQNFIIEILKVRGVLRPSPGVGTCLLLMPYSISSWPILGHNRYHNAVIPLFL